MQGNQVRSTKRPAGEATARGRERGAVWGAKPHEWHAVAGWPGQGLHTHDTARAVRDQWMRCIVWR